MLRNKCTLLLFLLQIIFIKSTELPIYWWQRANGDKNFGDELSHVIVERIIGHAPRRANSVERKLVALGSMLHAAHDGDTIWGTGVNGKAIELQKHHFTHLDIRAVRGPITRFFLLNHGITCPEIYGDPALTMPLLFPEFKKTLSRDYIVIPHIFDIINLQKLGLDPADEHLVLPTEPWDIVVQKILESKLVISSSLHGIIVAEAFHVPARFLRISNQEPLLKYYDYYLATGRYNFTWATGISEALSLGGEAPAIFDAQALLAAFPYDQYYPEITQYKKE